ncbi:MAG: carboxypeptidase-like regulatory domain-containing protein [Pirellula sp.]
MMMPSIRIAFTATIMGVIVSSPVRAQPKYELQGKWLQQDDHAFAFASTDNKIPGVHFQLVQPTTLKHTGVVLDSDGMPVANAEVWFFVIFGRIPLRERTTTKADGTYEMNLPMMDALGQVQWGACAVRGNACSGTIHRPAPNGVKFQLNAGRKLVLRAKESAADKNSGGPEKPIVRYTVHLEDGRVVLSDPRGVCSLEGLPPRVQYIGLSSPGYAYQYWMIDLYENRNFEFTASMTTGGTVTGIVRDQDEKPVPWNEVSGRTCETVVINVGRTFTNDLGRYELSGMRMDRKRQVHAFSHRTGNARYSEDNEVDFQGSNVAMSDFQITPGRIQPPEPGVIVALAAEKESHKGYIRGKVQPRDGKPCTDFNIRVFPSAVAQSRGGYAASYESIGITFASPDGTFVFSGLPMDSANKLVVTAPGYRDEYVDPVMTVSQDELDQSEVVVFEPEKASLVRLQVVDANGQPVSGAEARLFRVGTNSNVHATQKENFLYKGTSNAQGWIEVPDVSLAFGRWVVDAKGFVEQQFPWNGEPKLKAELTNAVTVRLKFQLDGESENKMAFMIIAKDGRIIHQKKDVPSDEGEWVIPGLLPDQYTLGIDSPTGLYQFCFDGIGNQQFRRPLNLPPGDGDVREFSFQVKPYVPKAK